MYLTNSMPGLIMWKWERVRDMETQTPSSRVVISLFQHQSHLYRHISYSRIPLNEDLMAFCTILVQAERYHVDLLINNWNPTINVTTKLST